MSAAVAISAADADHTSCQEREKELEAKIERLESRLEDADMGVVHVNNGLVLFLFSIKNYV